jgi:hypothetical protein
MHVARRESAGMMAWITTYHFPMGEFLDSFRLGWRKVVEEYCCVVYFLKRRGI